MNYDEPIEIRDARNGEWFWVEKTVWQNTLLTSSDKVAYGTLAYFANGKTQSSYPSLIKIAKQSALSERQVALSIKKLEKLKYISVKRHFGKSNIYTLLKTRYAKFAVVKGMQNRRQGYSKYGVGGMQNSSTNKNYITRLNNNKVEALKELIRDKAKQYKGFHN